MGGLCLVYLFYFNTRDVINVSPPHIQGPRLWFNLPLTVYCLIPFVIVCCLKFQESISSLITSTFDCMISVIYLVLTGA